MPFNPGGVFSLVASYFASPGATIRTEQHNPVFEDVGAALSQVLVRDGRAPMTGPLNMNGFAIANVAPGTSSGNVATLAQAMPIGAVIDFAGTNAPTGWLLCFGQAVSRTTYALLFTLIGTTYGAGDGSTTFNLPDLRGRVSAGKDDMGGTAANRLTSAGAITGTTLGYGGGEQLHTMTLAELVQHSHTATTTNAASTFTLTINGSQSTVDRTDFAGITLPGSGITAMQKAAFDSQTPSVTIPAAALTLTTTVNQTGSSVPFNVVQPTIILNKIIRVSYDG